MLRRAPTSISLSMRDVEEHFEHIKQEKAKEHENNPPNRRQPSSSLSSTGFVEIRPERHYHYEHSKIGPRQGQGLQNISNNFPFSISFGSAQMERVPAGAERPGTVSPDQLPTVLEDDEAKAELHTDVEDGGGSIPVTSPSSSGSVEEPPKLQAEVYSEQSSARASNKLDYGGFEETNEDANSSFAPQDISTPRNIESKDVYKLRAQTFLSRSPLSVSHGVDSLQRQPTSSLTPCVASYGTPSVLLSQPARRPMSYRPRVLSYSFAESEGANAAHEEVQGFDNESIRSEPACEEWRSLQEDLEEQWSQSVSVNNSVPSSPADVAVDLISASRRSSQAVQISERKRDIYSSSSQLPLPPPFSTVRRNISSIAALPSQSRSSSASSPRSGIQGLRGSRLPDQREQLRNIQHLNNALRSLATLPLRLLELYRSRSPLPSRNEITDQELESSASGRGFEGQSRAVLRPCSPLPPMQVYDDRLPASSQPQTPQHLPESRHQSRLHPSYTVPSSAQMERRQLRRLTDDRPHSTRSESPPGLTTPGFYGLYGGQENADEEVMFDRAAQRLFAASSARPSGPSMHDTPERERSLAAAEGRDDR